MITSSRSKIVATMICILLPVIAPANADVDGVLGMSVVQGQSYMAVWVPLDHDQAIAGVQWYHNDMTTQFTTLQATAGGQENPGSSQSAMLLAENVTGGSLQWCGQTFTEEVASVEDGLYVLFQLPLGSVYEQDGTGGGAGIGYKYEPGGPGAWLSLDGEAWLPLHPDYRLAVEPVLVEAGTTTTRLERTGGKNLAVDEESVPLRTELLAPTPNPFNPMATLRFSLERACRIDLSVYNLRGRKVSTLAEGPYSAGSHVVVWSGRDDDDRSTASGLYLARLKADGRELTQRMLLVR